MRFATDEVAFIGGFGGLAADVWLVEPFAYLSHDAGVWAIQAGAAVPIVRLETVRVSIRFGTSPAVSGPAVEPDIHPTLGAGVRIVPGTDYRGPRQRPGAEVSVQRQHHPRTDQLSALAHPPAACRRRICAAVHRAQVEHHRESTRRQYDLAERARKLGWSADQSP